MTPDVNVPVAASRGDHPHHAVAHRWLEQAIADTGTGSPLRLPPMVIASFLECDQK
jgi:predicted nucleic acid-binding protein